MRQGGRILHTRLNGPARSPETYRRIFTSQIGFFLPMVKVEKVLTMPLFFRFCCRAQKRIAQQRIDSKLDLGRVVDIRKKAFAEVKVCQSLRSVSLRLDQIRFAAEIL